MTIDKDDILSDILFEIQDISQDGKWFLGWERLAELLGLFKEEYFRKFYSWKSGRTKDQTLQGFRETDGHLLIEFLTHVLKIPDIESDFVHFGLYFHEKSLDILNQMYRNLVTSTLENHTLDKELMMLLATSTLDYDDAVDSYLADKFSPEFFEKKAVADFIQFYKVDSAFGAEDTLLQHLRSLIPTKVLNFQTLTKEFRERTYYEMFGTIREPKQNKKTASGKKKARTGSSQRSKTSATLFVVEETYRQLLVFFGLTESSSSVDLRKSYKAMIKKHHPDINKKGLEMTQVIIANYNALLQMMKDKGL